MNNNDVYLVEANHPIFQHVTRFVLDISLDTLIEQLILAGYEIESVSLVIYEV